MERGSAAPTRVLVVDDNEDAAQSLGLLLRLLGHEVHVEIDARRALAMAPGLRPDVVILDLGMPDIDGYEAARQLRADPECRSAKIIAVTGYGRDEDRRKSAEAGFDAHLLKPVSMAELEAEIDG